VTLHLRTFIAAALLQATLFAANGQEFKEARALFDAHDYEHAYERFWFLFEEDMGSTEINYYLGRSAFEIREYQEAIAAFERILFADPDNMKARFELGRSYFALKMYDEAELSFNNILVRPIPAELRDQVNQYVKKIMESRQRHLLSALVNFAFQDDTNINNGNEYTTGLVNPTVSDRSLVANVALTHTYKLTDKYTNWLTKANLYHQQNYEAHDYDIEYPALQSGYQINERNYMLYFPLGYEVLKLGESVRFNAFSLGAEGTWLISKRDQLFLKLKAQSKQYFAATDDGRDAYIYSFDGRYVASGSGDKYIFSLGADMEREKEKTRPNNDVDNNTYRLGLAYQNEIDRKSLFFAAYRVTNRLDLEESTMLTTEKRNDLHQSLSFSYMVKVENGAMVSVYTTFANGQSNHDAYDYDKSVYGISYTVGLGHDDLVGKSLKGE